VVRGTRVRAADDQFTIVLDKPAPKSGLVVRWVASEVKVDVDDDSGDTEWWVKWVVVLFLTLLAVGSGFAAFWVTVWRRKDQPSEDNGLEFASFLKVSALVTIAVIALVGVMLATVEESANLAALFTLLGTIAGYLAGTRPSTEEVPEPEEPPEGEQRRAKPRTIKRSLL
jgi:hypothetical protein